MVLSFSCVLEIPPPTSLPLTPLPPFPPSLLCLIQTLIINSCLSFPRPYLVLIMDYLHNFEHKANRYYSTRGDKNEKFHSVEL